MWYVCMCDIVCVYLYLSSLQSFLSLSSKLHLEWNGDMSILEWNGDMSILEWNGDKSILEWNGDKSILEWNGDMADMCTFVDCRSSLVKSSSPCSLAAAMKED